MNVALIPVRGGSKSIPLKNIKKICEQPLVYWTAKAACECKKIDKVYIATDSQKIRESVTGFVENNPIFEKIEIIERSKESSVDTAPTEIVMLEFAEKYKFDNIILIQATSPLLSSSDLEKGFDIFNEEDTDSVLSVVYQKRFNWKMNENGYIEPLNYDVYNRPRRQDFDGYYVENGAFYITKRDSLLKTKNRVSGKIKAVVMNENSFYEIDEPNDWFIVEMLMRRKIALDKKEMPEIKMFLTDCDGCLTDSGMYYSESGDELKKFNTRDGVGFRLLQEKGIITGVITSENVELNRRRANKLKLDILEMGCKNKLETIKSLCKKYNISLENIFYIGDDINDLDVMKVVGFSCCPIDAIEKVKNVAKYVSPVRGGFGLIRDAADLLLEFID